MAEQYPGSDPLDSHKDGDWDPFDPNRGISGFHQPGSLYDSMEGNDGEVRDDQGRRIGHDDWSELDEAPGGFTIVE